MRSGKRFDKEVSEKSIKVAEGLAKESCTTESRQLGAAESELYMKENS
jgi:hypothetical protein